MPYEGESDRELVTRVTSGDTSAFETLHKRYHSKIYRLALMQSGNAPDAEDIAAETFCRALERISQFQFRGGETIYPWLHRIAGNLCIDMCRDRASHGMVSLDDESEQGVRAFVETLESSAPTPEEILQRHEVQRLVQAAIASLPPDQCEVIVHRFLAELDLDEIAQVMRRSSVAVRSLLHRAVISLRKEILARVDKSERMRLLGRLGESTDVRRDSIRIRRGTDETK